MANYVARTHTVYAYNWGGEDKASVSSFLRGRGVEIVDFLVVARPGRMACFEGDSIALVIGRRVMRAQRGDWLVFSDSGAVLVMQDDHFQSMFTAV